MLFQSRRKPGANLPTFLTGRNDASQPETGEKAFNITLSKTQSLNINLLIAVSCKIQIIDASSFVPGLHGTTGWDCMNVCVWWRYGFVLQCG